MSQAKTNKRSYNNNHGSKQPRHAGPKVRVIDLSSKDAHKGMLIELTVEALKRFYKTIDSLRLGNYKTGFNTYQYGLVIVEGFSWSRMEDDGFAKVSGTLFGLVKAEDFLRLSSSKSEPALADYEQAIFIEDEGGIFIDGADTKVAVTKFRTNGPSKKFVVTYRSTEQFTSTMVEELFALDILPQFRKELSHVNSKQEARNEDETRHEAKPAAKSASRPPREQQPRRPMKKTAEPLHASA